jgi:putative ABC transport system ATP-binding protein
MRTMIGLERVHKKYSLGKTTVTALQETSMQIREGELVALAGPSGSGKSTLLNIAGCLDKPDAGRVWLDDEEVTGIALSGLAVRRRRRLGFVFQTFNLIPVLTAFENVEYPLMLDGMARRERHAVAGAWLERVGIGAQANQRPDQLSGGQRQRVAIARAMVAGPAVVIADEPTANLDSVTTENILDLLQGINERTATTFLIATHDPRVLERASRTLYLRDGRIEYERVADAARERTVSC